MIAMEWCGIIARMYDSSCTVAWLRTNHSARANTATLPPTMATLTTRFRYMLSMNPSMITAMTAPMSRAIQARVWLKNTWSSAVVFRYIRPNMTTVDVATIAAKRA